MYLIVALVLVGLLGYWRFRTTPFNWATFAANFRDVNWWWISVSVVFILFTYLGRAVRWRVMMQHLHANLPFTSLLAITLIGFSAVVLSGRPGEFVRPYLIARRANVAVSSQIASWAIERILDLFMVLFIFGVALSQISRGAAVPGSQLQLILRVGGWSIGLLSGAALIVLIGFRHFQGRAQKRISEALTVFPEAIHLKIDGFLQSFAAGTEALRSPSAISSLIFYTVVEWLVIGISFYSLFQAFPSTAHLPATDVVVILGFVSFGAAIQIPGIGGGMQVAAIFVLTELYQLTFEEASGVALALWLVNYFSVVPVGLLLAFREGLNWRNLKKIEEEVGGGPKTSTTVA